MDLCFLGFSNTVTKRPCATIFVSTTEAPAAWSLVDLRLVCAWSVLGLRLLCGWSALGLRLVCADGSLGLLFL